MAVLCDDNAVYLLLPTSAKCTARCGALTMPDPDQPRDQAAGHDLDVCGDVWFEDCGDGSCGAGDGCSCGAGDGSSFGGGSSCGSGLFCCVGERSGGWS